MAKNKKNMDIYIFKYIKINLKSISFTFIKCQFILLLVNTDISSSRIQSKFQRLGKRFISVLSDKAVNNVVVCDVNTAWKLRTKFKI